jgi:hypothetical protein
MSPHRGVREGPRALPVGLHRSALSIHYYFKRDSRFSYFSEIGKRKKMSKVIIGLLMLFFFIILLLLFWIILFTIALLVFSEKEKKGEVLPTGIEGN